MSSILATKLYLPPPRHNAVLRPRLIALLNDGLSANHKLTLISAPAGYGKTTLLSEWVASAQRPAAWLSLDEADSDPTRFLSYLIAALQQLTPQLGLGLAETLSSPQPPSTQAILTALLNELTTLSDPFTLVLDDYHLLDSKPIDAALAFLLEHLPPPMHLVIATREDPHLPLARYRARDQLTELRAADLRFAPSEAADYLNQVMGLNLSPEDIAALETRTEGWIAGLQLAALSLQGHQDAAGYIQSFTGSHRFVLDYLVEEVLQRQPASVQRFLLRTSLLDRLCGPLCDAVLRDPAIPGQETLEQLERANLFLVPLDHERRWYRYHHLFGGFLRQRLLHQAASSPADPGLPELHLRASQWYEDNGLEFEAFHHATAANDIERAARLILGRGMPLHVRGATEPVIRWLASLPEAELNARPVLWVMYAGALTAAGLTSGVEHKLQAAEAALLGAPMDADTRDLLGRIANNRATLDFLQYHSDQAIAQAGRALEYLRPDNLPVRTLTTWVLGAALVLKKDWASAGEALTEAIASSKVIGHTFVTKLATMGLGRVQEAENQLVAAADTYRRTLEMVGDYSPPWATEAYLGLARIHYEWNDLDAAQQHGQKALQVSRQWDQMIDRHVVSELFLARLQLARGDVAGAAAMLAETDRSVRQHNFTLRMPEVAETQVWVLLHQENPRAAADLARAHQLPLSQARAHLALGDPAAALAVLEPHRRLAEDRCWPDESLRVMVLQSVALAASGEKDQALRLLAEALTLAEPGGMIRVFVDEGPPMARLLSELAGRGMMSACVARLLAAFGFETPDLAGKPLARPTQPLIEPLSERELEVLRLVARGLSNREIGQRLFLALSTVKGHNRLIFDKLQVVNRTEAVARARELGLL